MTSSCSEGDVGDVNEHSMRCLRRHVVWQTHCDSWGALLYICALCVAAKKVTGVAQVGDRSGGTAHCVGCVGMATMFCIFYNRITV